MFVAVLTSTYSLLTLSNGINTPGGPPNVPWYLLVPTPVSVAKPVEVEIPTRFAKIGFVVNFGAVGAIVGRMDPSASTAEPNFPLPKIPGDPPKPPVYFPESTLVTGLLLPLLIKLLKLPCCALLKVEDTLGVEALLKAFEVPPPCWKFRKLINFLCSSDDKHLKSVHVLHRY